MISKDREDDGNDQSSDALLSPDNAGQVGTQSKSEVTNMPRPSSVGNTLPRDDTNLERREDTNDNSDNVHNLLGRSFNGDLIASQVYLCITCGIEVEDAESLRRHELQCCSTMSLEDTEGFRKLVCEICRAYFSETDHLQEHKLLHLNTSNVCYLCDTFFANRYLLARHVVCQHSDRFGVKQNEEGVHEPYTCAICILRFSTLIALQSHEDSHGVTEKTPTCRICSVSNATHQALQSHLKTNLHAEMKHQLQNLFTCIDCSTVFHCRDAYAMHMMMRAKDESCKKTPKVSPQKDDTKGNPSIVIVKEEPADSPKPECANASNTFLGTVSKVNNVKSLCGSQSRSESPIHGKTHMCPGCGMLCFDSNQLLRHLRMCGSVLNPQSNDSWGQAQNGLVFKWAVNKTYSLHLPTTMNRKEKQCSYCHKSFLDQDDLAMHVMSDHARDMGETDRTKSPPTNARGWHQPERNGDCNLIVYSPSSVAVLGPRDSKLSPVHNTLLHQGHTVRQNDTSLGERNDNEVEETSGGKNNVEINTSENLSTLQVDAIEETVKSTEDNVSRKRRRRQSLSAVFSSHQNAHDSRPKSADIANSCNEEISGPEIKRQLFSTSTGFSIPVNNVNSPLDLSRGLRDAQSPSSSQDTSEVRKQVIKEENLESQQICENQETRMSTGSCLIDDPVNVIPEANSTGPTGMSRPENTEQEVITNDLNGEDDPPLLDCLLENRKNLFQCRYCKIVYMDRTLYCLHMGLHNVNNPWQCNMCGKAFESVHQFSSHVLHF